MKYDLVIRDCLVVDPTNGVRRVTSVGIADGKILELGDIDGSAARQVVGFPGSILMPGIIDCHMHSTEMFGGVLALGMLARAGVTTALDMAGPVSEVLKAVKEHGFGINIASLETAWPGVTVKDNDPSVEECDAMRDRAMSGGALGLKILGGHYPLTPEGSRNVIESAHRGKVYIAFHAGSTRNGSNMAGVFDAVEFAEGRPFHLPHVNAYCRGMTLGDVREEVRQAMRLLIENRQILSEFHVAPLNAAHGHCTNGVPEDRIAVNCLKMGGYEQTEDGLRRALRDEYAQVLWMNRDGKNCYVKGPEALEYWESHGTDCMCCFPVNNRETAFLCASSRDENGKYVMDALSTDGGGVPRNFMIEMGTLLIDWGLWTLDDYVRMTSLHPARMLGLHDKGHLTPGTDADITVFDPVTRTAILSIVDGKIVCVNGILVGKEGSVICTPRGTRAVKDAGLVAKPVDIEECALYKGKSW